MIESRLLFPRINKNVCDRKHDRAFYGSKIAGSLCDFTPCSMPFYVSRQKNRDPLRDNEHYIHSEQCDTPSANSENWGNRAASVPNYSSTNQHYRGYKFGPLKCMMFQEDLVWLVKDQLVVASKKRAKGAASNQPTMQNNVVLSIKRLLLTSVSESPWLWHRVKDLETVQ